MAKRRTDEQTLADLEARMAHLKARAARLDVARDPALRHVRAALRSIDKALSETRDEGLRRALGEASTTLATCLGIRKPMTWAARMARVRGPDQWRAFEEDAVLRYVRENPASASEEIAAALGTDTTSLRAALQRLQAKGKVKSGGQGRATRYFAGGV